MGTYRVEVAASAPVYLVLSVEADTTEAAKAEAMKLVRTEYLYHHAMNEGMRAQADWELNGHVFDEEVTSAELEEDSKDG